MALQLFNLEMAEQKLRSGSSLIEAYVLFINATQRDVNLYWIDYHGRQSFYLTLRPGLASKVDTFQTHPWIFRDTYSGERMQVEHEYTYWPKRYILRSVRNPSVLVSCRRKIAIHLPVRSLRESCLWTIVRQRGKTRDAIDKLNIPETLKVDLKNFQSFIEKYRSLIP